MFDRVEHGQNPQPLYHPCCAIFLFFVPALLRPWSLAISTTCLGSADLRRLARRCTASPPPRPTLNWPSPLKYHTKETGVANGQGCRPVPLNWSYKLHAV
ncbi:hypothetical protein B0O80DRAFT_445747 [Mortierella sp. GBAus27b]|nr:hypothetical protein B0O80DRAFT_445747 [Mortierella sp. GBAus27b]